MGKIDITPPSFVHSFAKLKSVASIASVPAASIGLETKQSEPAPPAQSPKKAASSNNDKGKKAQSKQQKKAKAKAKAKGKKAKASGGGGGATDLFAELDIRVGKILSAEKPAAADKLFTEVIDCGDESGPRTIASGLVGHYTQEQLTGKMVVVLCNLKPRPMKFIAP